MHKERRKEEEKKRRKGETEGGREKMPSGRSNNNLVSNLRANNLTSLTFKYLIVQ